MELNVAAIVDTINVIITAVDNVHSLEAETENDHKCSMLCCVPATLHTYQQFGLMLCVFLPVFFLN